MQRIELIPLARRVCLHPRMYTTSGSLAEILALFLGYDLAAQHGVRAADESVSQVIKWLSVTCSLNKDDLPAKRLEKIIQHFGTEQAALDSISTFLNPPRKGAGKQTAPSFHELRIQELFERATAIWRKGGFVELAPSFDGLPEARALCEALAQRHPESESLLMSALTDRSPHVVAYGLLALEMASSPRLLHVPEELRKDKRRFAVIDGCFADKLDIGDFVRQLQQRRRTGELAPNGGPTEPPGNSGVRGGPPSAS